MMIDLGHALLGQLTERGHQTDKPQLLETHISWVLLQGDFAWKIKKPIHLAFVDFSTLEKRKYFCEEEIRLNRRLAPDLYLEVVPVTGTLQNPVLEGDGEPIDYAVKMKSFPQDRLLKTVASQGKLPAQYMDQIAGTLANFHDVIAVAGPESEFGTAHGNWHDVEECLESLKSSQLNDSQRQMLAQISTQMPQLWESHQLDWESRRQEGFIRECHGDLHLGNMALLDERVMIFDGIDFNPQLRWIDVMSEVAFLVMDLEHCHDRSLAYRFLNHYCELTGDYAGLSTLPFYVAYRALVRAKVKGIRWDQEFELIPADEQEDMSELLRLALSYSSAHPSKLMITHGFSGSGKSTRTQTFVEQLGAIRIRSDVERKRLFQGQSKVELYSAQATELTYQKLLTLAEIILRAGFPVILDATFLKYPHRKMFHELAEKCGAEFQILSFYAPLEVLKARVKNRAQHGGDVSDADLAVLEAQYRNHDPLTAAEQPFVQQIDTTVD